MSRLDDWPLLSQLTRDLESGWPPVFLSADWFAGWIYVWFSCWKAGFFLQRLSNWTFVRRWVLFPWLLPYLSNSWTFPGQGILLLNSRTFPVFLDPREPWKLLHPLDGMGTILHELCSVADTPTIQGNHFEACKGEIMLPTVLLWRVSGIFVVFFSYYRTNWICIVNHTYDSK